MINKLRIIFILMLCSLFGNGSAFAFDATLVHQYTFSDLWNSTNDVKDSVGTSDGQVFGGATRIIDDNFLGLAATCSVADFNNGYILVDSLGLNTNDNIQTSVSFWIKWKGNEGNEGNRQMPMAWNTFDLLFRGSDFGFNNFNGNSKANNIFGVKSDVLNKNGGNDWVHIAAVFTNRTTDSRNKLYINGELQSLSNLKNGFGNRNEYSVIAQTLSIGGHVNGTSEYPINGSIGNFRIYEGEITQTQVRSDMSDIDDACTPLPPPFSPIVEYHFDNEHLSITNGVIDSSGNNNHGTAFSVDNTDGLLCDAADFSATGISDYIVANNKALDGLTDFTAMVWVKTSQTSDLTVFSAGSADSGLGTNEAIFYFFGGERFWPSITATPFDTSTQLNSTSNVNNDQWHQVVWTRDASTAESCFFFDGVVRGCVTHTDGDDNAAISVLNGGLILGQEQDSLGGGFQIDQSFIGLMDEFMIFPDLLEETDIATINNNIRAGNNWDGSLRACLSGPPILDMRFDEESWSGSDTVIDSSGNNFHGTAFGQAMPVEGLSCNAVDLSTTGTSDYVSANYQAINGLTDFSVVFWGKQNLDENHNMVPISGSNESASNEMLLFFTVRSRIQPHINDSRDVIDFNDDNNWHQFVWTRDASTRESCVYRDGALLGCGDLGTSNPLRISPGGFIIGQEQDKVGGDFVSSQAWDGLIDELLIFPSVLTQAQIQLYRQHALDQKDWQGNLKSCDSIVDHYRFELPSAGLTCAPSDIKISACEDEFCSTFSSEISALTLSPSGQWSGDNVTGNVVSFIRETGVGGVGLSHPTAESISISASNLNPIPTSDNPIQCFVGTTSTSCTLAFADAGFIFSTIPTQISSKSSSQEFNATTLTIQAVEKDTKTGACEAVFPANTDVDIELKLNCSSGTCSDINVTTGSSTTSQSIGQGYSNIPFRFSDNSLATYELTYPNSGKMSLSARKVDSLESGATLIGTSNDFVVKPFGFKFEFPNGEDPFSDGNPATGGDFSVFKKAGEDFAINAIAIGWQSGEDANNDGNIDADQNANDNPTIRFFANEAVKLSHELQYPSTGSSGTFSASNSLLSDLTGTSTANFMDAKWSEVGVISLTAALNDSDYLGTGNVTGVVTNVGRFTPSHFDVSDIVAGDLTGQCSNQTFIGELTAGGLGALTYGGQNPSMTLIAKNLDGEATVNYRDDFYRFGTVTATFDSLVHVDDSSLLPPSLITLSGANNIGTMEQKATESLINYGQFIYTAPDNDHFVYTRDENSKVAPFPANIQYKVQTLTDIDGIGLASGASPILNAISSTTPTQAHKMVYGRITLDNTFGPETETLAMPVRHEIFKGINFETNTSIGESCAQDVFPSIDISLSPLPLGDLDLSQIELSTPWRSGEAALLIPPPNTAQGDVDVELTVPAWLMFDWDNKPTTIDTNPTATATFGRYRGNDRIINWRENR